VQQGLSLIEERSGALGRFLRAYAQLARLPKPTTAGAGGRPRQPDRRAGEAAARHRAPVTRRAARRGFRSARTALDQRAANAVDASLETGGSVAIGWKRGRQWLELTIDDEGKGLPDTSNLFVPFFTTKPNGSGIGLALSRQIAEAHNGTIALENRNPAPGCRATLRLPV
jgi:nitrogen fixation/metabolism regulation signal transduction histidine kinase